MSVCQCIAWNVALLCICVDIAASVMWQYRMDDHALIHHMFIDLSHRHIQIYPEDAGSFSPIDNTIHQEADHSPPFSAVV